MTLVLVRMTEPPLVLVASGVRYDLAVESPAYVEELVTHHVGGYLKIAPEHTEPGPLARMLKPDLASFHRFKDLFQRAAQAAGKEYYLIPYFIAAHPGTSDHDMLALALWLLVVLLTALTSLWTLMVLPLCLVLVTLCEPLWAVLLRTQAALWLQSKLTLTLLLAVHGQTLRLSVSPTAAQALCLTCSTCPKQWLWLKHLLPLVSQLNVLLTMVLFIICWLLLSNNADF